MVQSLRASTLACHCLYFIAVPQGLMTLLSLPGYITKQRTWRHEGHGAGGDDDVPRGDLAADVHPPRQAVLHAVGARQLAVADQDVLHTSDACWMSVSMTVHLQKLARRSVLIGSPVRETGKTLPRSASIAPAPLALWVSD